MKQNPVFERLTALADPIRARLLLALERRELTVSELRAALQLPQSTVSRHLRALADAGWVASREDGTSNRYRMTTRELGAGARRLWNSVREDIGTMPAAVHDAERVRSVIAARHSTSERFFASSAGQWEKMRAELFGVRTELYALLGLLEAEWTVADIGCGTGQLTEAIAPFVSRVIAIDESAAMLRAARGRLSGTENVEVRHGTIESLPLEDAEIDVAVLTLVLQYVSDPLQALAEIFRSLKRPGRLLIVDMLPHEMEQYRETMGHVWLGFHADQLRQWSDEAGFTTCRSHPLQAATNSKAPNLFAAVLHKR